MGGDTRADIERRESREWREAVLTALRVVGPGGGTVIVDGHEVTVLDTRSLGLRAVEALRGLVCFQGAGRPIPVLGLARTHVRSCGLLAGPLAVTLPPRPASAP